MEKISVIVPIFHGIKYIDNMIAQLEKCVEKSSNRCTIELLLVNDYPAEQIGYFSSEKINVRVIETDRNRGIHGARVRGLNHCTGDYVLFLDQDDIIYPDYFNSQLEHLNNKAAVVCKLLHEGRQYYDNRTSFEKVLNREFMIGSRNPIISPGQVLLKKNRIPKIWTDIALKNNGADDWLLWLCMFSEGSEFALNPSLLFEHVVEGQNESVNIQHMENSEKELYEVVAANGILTGQELENLHDTIKNVAAGRVATLVKFRRMFFVYDAWLRLMEQDISISEYLLKRGINSVAVYGDNQIGKRLYHALKKEGICVKYFIDMNAEYLEEEIPVYMPAAPLHNVDMVIISLVESIDSIRKTLSGLLDTKIYGITELIEEIEKSTRIYPTEGER
ncbi:MAG: glycosyltransferase [Lachnospiraceae bacterium]|nr:glycosyltransferase [Lachnospiraceae bacterium]